MQKFFKFCVVGALGFIADSLAFLILISIIDNPLISRVIAFWFAASITWLGNRLYTFQLACQQRKLRQWSKHMLSAHASGVLNILIFWQLLNLVPVSIAFIAGTCVGAGSNYFLASYIVFTNNTHKVVSS